jgi:hypothetical protein
MSMLYSFMTTKQNFLRTALLGGALALAGIGELQTVQAQTHFTFSTELDLSAGYFQDAGGGSSFYLVPFAPGQPQFTLLPGDTISGRITFANSQYMQVSDPGAAHPEYVSLAFYPSASDSTDFQSLTTLLGVGGQLNASNPQALTGSGNTVISATFFGLTDSSLTFTGLDYSITLNSLTGDNHFTPANLQIYAGTGDISVQPTPTPEPSTRALAGLGGLSLLGLRRKIQARFVNQQSVK